jgi:hypothetical protein
MARRSIRCDIKNARTGQRCGCRIDRDRAYLHDHLGFTGPACCENHYKVMRRGKLIEDIHGRVYKLVLLDGSYTAVQSNRTPCVGDEEL